MGGCISAHGDKGAKARSRAIDEQVSASYSAAHLLHGLDTFS